MRCRGDVDDRVLMEAILPLLQGLASSPDVRPVLHRRFDMRRWFLSQVSCRPPASSGTPRVCANCFTCCMRHGHCDHDTESYQ